MVKIIDGKVIAEKIKDEVAKDIYQLNGPRPNLAIILVGERDDSKIYVALKEKEGRKIGVDTHLYKMDGDILESELLATINFLNDDPTIDGILLQLPLPQQFNADKIIAAINPLKDVDGFHPEHPKYIESPVLSAVKACLEEINFSAPDKSACLMYNSEIFGQSLKDALSFLNLQVLPAEQSSQADLLITALGKPGYVKQNMIKDGAVIIDIGITKEDGRVWGDVDFEDVKDKAAFITPVPGGIGPMTIAFLFKNVWEVYRRRHGLI
jgi:methylenetetrahydrofolate dehydrogenase (NADP+)/methenyltetrahydrofolate cyclohydrolase